MDSEALTVAGMRAVERAAMDAGAATGADLMERAGRAVVGAMRLWRPGLFAPGRRVAVLCGPGANGGDGYVVARRLREAGLAVRVHALDASREPTGDAGDMRRRWAALGPTRPLEACAGDADATVDALFGAGLSRPLPEAAARALAVAGGAVVSVDGPSGLCLDTGLARGAAARAALTVTFHRAKAGHLVADGPEFCGRLRVADIGLEPFAAAAGGAALRLAPAPAPLDKAGAAHKHAHGHVLALAGGPARGGAARLAARAALRVGAGLATVGAPGAALIENAARLDAVMTRRVDGPQDFAAALVEGRVAAVVVGPGLGLDARGRALLAAALASPARLTLDADALTLLAEMEDWPGRLRAGPGARAVLTPHMGEFARLFPDLAAGAANPDLGGRPSAARAAAARCGGVVLLKGRDTLIAAPDGRLALHAAVGDRAAPQLATAGSGDVLAGLICGLAARGLAPFEAACAGAWLHVEAALALGPGLTADDLPEALPAVLRALAERRRRGVT